MKFTRNNDGDVVAVVKIDAWHRINTLEICLGESEADSNFIENAQNAVQVIASMKCEIDQAIRVYDWKSKQRDVCIQINGISVYPLSRIEFEIQISIDKYATDDNDDFGLFITVNNGKITSMVGAT